MQINLKIMEQKWRMASLFAEIPRFVQLWGVSTNSHLTSRYLRKQQVCTASLVPPRMRWLERMLRTRTSEGMATFSHGPKRCRYSPEMMNAFTISALTKLPLNWLSLLNQKLKPSKFNPGSGGPFGLRRM